MSYRIIENEETTPFDLDRIEIKELSEFGKDLEHRISARDIYVHTVAPWKLSLRTEIVNKVYEMKFYKLKQDIITLIDFMENSTIGWSYESDDLLVNPVFWDAVLSGELLEEKSNCSCHYYVDDGLEYEIPIEQCKFYRQDYTIIVLHDRNLKLHKELENNHVL